MEDKIKNIFIAGLPKSGKTTLIKKVVSLYSSKIRGFYTEEIIGQKNERVGFKIVNTTNEEKIFAIKHNAKNIIPDYSLHKIQHYKKYDIFEDVLEEIAIEYIENFLTKKEFVIVIDEIGAMECLSKKFCSLVTKIISLQKPLIATLRYNTHPFIDDIKKIGNSKMFVLERNNHNVIFDEIEQWIKNI